MLAYSLFSIPFPVVQPSHPNTIQERNNTKQPTTIHNKQHQTTNQQQTNNKQTTINKNETITKQSKGNAYLNNNPQQATTNTIKQQTNNKLTINKQQQTTSTTKQEPKINKIKSTNLFLIMLALVLN